MIQVEEKIKYGSKEWFQRKAAKKVRVALKVEEKKSRWKMKKEEALKRARDERADKMRLQLTIKKSVES